MAVVLGRAIVGLALAAAAGSGLTGCAAAAPSASTHSPAVSTPAGQAGSGSLSTPSRPNTRSAAASIAVTCAAMSVAMTSWRDAERGHQLGQLSDSDYAAIMNQLPAELGVIQVMARRSG